MLTTYFTADRIPEDAAYPFGTLKEITRDLRLTVHAGRVTHVDPAKREVAAGDCAVSVDVQIGKPQAVGLGANAGRQGDVAGANMAGKRAAYEGSLIHNITHFMDMDFISLGDKRLPGEHRVFSHKEGGL